MTRDSRSRSARSRSPKRTRSKSKSRSRRRSKSRSLSLSEDGFRLHIGDLDGDITERQLGDAFSKFGPIVEVWMARYPPWFAFIVFKSKRDSEDALRDMNHNTIHGCRIRVTVARPRRRGPRGPPPPRYNSYFERPPIQCYDCGGYGHISRECRNSRLPPASYGYNRSARSFRSRSRSGGRRSRSKTYSPPRSPRR